MNSHLTEIRDKQKNTWNSFSGGWKKWDEMTMNILKPWGDGIIEQLSPKDGDTVLDIAAGTGEPGLSIAAMVGSGKVVITDLAEGMLATAREKTELLGFKNVELLPCDVSDLPFEDNSFDAISCRFGFMFFPDMNLAASELHRVLKPGGRIAVALWGKPEDNFWVTAFQSVVMKNLDLPHPPADAPGIFRCAEPQVMQDVFASAAFNNIAETQISGKFTFESSAQYWDFMSEVVAPVAFLSQSEEVKAKIRSEVMMAIDSKYPNGNIAIDAKGYVISGQK
jgi:ubiquinone/menaquinone biosynthesis C-methylase UbiE